MNKPILLTRDAILKAQDIKSEKLHVPEWGGTVYVQGLTVAERDEYDDFTWREDEHGKIKFHSQNAQAKLLQLSLVDKNGQRLFDAKDIEALSQKSDAAAVRILKIAKRLSGLETSAVDDAVKNSPEGQSDDSSSN